MAIRDYLLSQLRARQGLAESGYRTYEQQAQLEAQKAARERERNLAIQQALSTLGGTAIKGLETGYGIMQAEAQKESAARLQEAIARGQLEGLEEEAMAEMAAAQPVAADTVSPAGRTALEELLGGPVSVAGEQDIAALQEQQRRTGGDWKQLAEGRALLEEERKRQAAQEARTPEEKDLIAALGVQPLSVPEQRKEEGKKAVGAISRQMDNVLADIGIQLPKTDEELVAEMPEGDFEFTEQELYAEPAAEIPEDQVDFDMEEPTITSAKPAAERELLAKATAVEEVPVEVSPEEKRVEAALDKAEKQSGFQIRRFKSNPNDIAKRIVDEVYAKKPAGNPLLQFFSGDPAKAAREKIIAQAAVAGKIKEERANLIENDFNMWMKEQGAMAAAERVKAAQLGAQAAMARAQKTIRLKTNLSGGERQKLEGYYQAAKQLEDVYKYGKQVLDEGRGFPLGRARAAIKAYIEENAGVQGSISKGAGGNLGAAGFGAGLSNSIAKNKSVDADLLQSAFRKMDTKDLSPSQKMFLQNLTISIQNVGKALEGGKLTDADFVKYLENLVSQDDPQVALKNINDLIRRNTDYHNAMYNNLMGTYEQSALQGYEPLEPTYFTDEEISAAFETPITTEAAGIKGRIPGLGEPQVAFPIPEAVQDLTTPSKPKTRKVGSGLGSQDKFGGF